MGCIKRREVKEYNKIMGRMQQTETAIDLALSDPNLTDEARAMLEEQKATIDQLQARDIGSMRGRRLDQFNSRLRAEAAQAADLVEMLADAQPGLALQAVDAPLSVTTTSPLDIAAEHADGDSGTDWRSGAELNRMAMSDPESFGEYWEGLDDAGRQAAQMQMQQASSTQMQLSTMMSTLLKNDHESSMAIIRNLSV